MEIFLLTKPPDSDRAELCLRLMEGSRGAALYLAGDGVYNLLKGSLKSVPAIKMVACREDLQARGVAAGEGVVVPDDFYQLLVEDMMADGNRIYTF